MHHGSPHFPVDGNGDLSGARTRVAAEALPGTAAGMPVADGSATIPVAGGAVASRPAGPAPSVFAPAPEPAVARAPGPSGNGVATSNGVATNGVHPPRAPRLEVEKADSQRKPQDPPKLFRLSPRTASLLGVQIVGCGSFAPANVVTNTQLESAYGYEPGWIEQRTGILSRRYAPEGMATSDMCVEAAKNAIRAANVNPADIDLVIVGTFTPDYLAPSTACLVQDRLGLDAPAVDMQAACSGFMYSMVTGAQYVATGNSKLALVIGADLMSRIVNTADQRTAPLFGDGAGAVLLSRGDPHQGLVCYQMGSDGSGGTMLGRLRGGSKLPLSAADVAECRHQLHMDGRSVFKWAVRALTETIDLVLSRSGMSVQDVGLFVIHQANERIIAYAMEQLGIPKHKVYNNLQNYGNTSAGSIPLVLDEAWRAGRIQTGDSIVMSGFGAGLSWGTALFRW